jgi:hypothetical protein
LTWPARTPPDQLGAALELLGINSGQRLDRQPDRLGDLDLRLSARRQERNEFSDFLSPRDPAGPGDRAAAASTLRRGSAAAAFSGS